MMLKCKDAQRIMHEDYFDIERLKAEIDGLILLACSDGRNYCEWYSNRAFNIKGEDIQIINKLVDVYKIDGFNVEIRNIIDYKLDIVDKIRIKIRISWEE